MEKDKRTYDDIRQDIISSYRQTPNVTKVARHHHVAPAAVSTILREEGFLLRSRKDNPTATPRRRHYDDRSCYYCHSFSRTSNTDGYCLRHRHSVKAKNTETCFN